MQAPHHWFALALASLVTLAFSTIAPARRSSRYWSTPRASNGAPRRRTCPRAPRSPCSLAIRMQTGST